MEGAWIPDDLCNRHSSQKLLASKLFLFLVLFRILFKSLGVLACLSLVAESNLLDTARSNIPI